ncbi:hypothetical protein BOX15_Mlig007744g2 [Macrostomum lignano]|uniref:Uncharacterized protein n=1 Tax=Macrostomum lignano TaxID=282301 RepID=A0A267GQC2_9PLAT|nr:hypothetical protein BOX15_Mlig007744g2 [Macrostomum lignano]
MTQIIVELPPTAAGSATRVIDLDADSRSGDLQAAVRRILTGGLSTSQVMPVCYLPSGGAPLSLQASADADSWDCLLLTALESRSPVRLCAACVLPGGKTHGRLGNAGKVRGQTPFVAKATEEKSRRQKTGRAKKRELCSRRFGGQLELLPRGRPVQTA